MSDILRLNWGRFLTHIAQVEWRIISLFGTNDYTEFESKKGK